ncbi:MAG: RNA polymerase sigma factor [Actinomycetota bacterium]|nr:RNA polymerase sigma factor [Actinomycetota bacterium]
MSTPFEAVVRQHGATVLRVCRALLGPHDAEDAWSEAFLAALRAYPGLADGANVEAWLVTIAHRKAIDTLRARARSTPVAEVPDEPSVARADGRDLDLWAALGGLADKQRAVVAYHYLGGLGYREVAQIVGGTEAAARRAGADGVANLRRALGGREQDETERGGAA